MVMDLDRGLTEGEMSCGKWVVRRLEDILMWVILGLGQWRREEGGDKRW